MSNSRINCSFLMLTLFSRVLELPQKTWKLRFCNHHPHTGMLPNHSIDSMFCSKFNFLSALSLCKSPAGLVFCQLKLFIRNACLNRLCSKGFRTTENSFGGHWDTFSPLYLTLFLYIYFLFSPVRLGRLHENYRPTPNPPF